MRIHLLGICGTFMGGIALLAKQMGFQVSGQDLNVYPPMSLLLKQAGIDIIEGFDPKYLKLNPDIVLIGNALSRGNPAVEYALNHGIPYSSGPEWLANNVLSQNHVIAISGTHGKTTTASLLTWILKTANMDPSFLIGGAPQNFAPSAHLGSSPFFVIEADEYDSAFFDKRPKFMHYRPKTLIINNIEFDHADIFSDLEAIIRQFQFLVRTVPGSGTIIYPKDSHEIKEVLSRGVWSATSTFGLKRGNWQAKAIQADGERFELWHRDQKLGVIEWQMVGLHNIHNALGAIAAAHDIGVGIDKSIKACQTFRGVKRRLELLGTVNNISVYDDFAHHPTAIATTIDGLRAKVGSKRIIAVLEFASNTMRAGIHKQQIAHALKAADKIVLLKPNPATWDLQHLKIELGARANLYSNVNDILEFLQTELKPDDQVLIMSNKGFDGIHQKLLNRLQESQTKSLN